MLKTASAFAVIIVLWVGYLIWPLHDAVQLVRAFDTRSVDALRTQLIDLVEALYGDECHATRT